MDWPNDVLGVVSMLRFSSPLQEKFSLVFSSLFLSLLLASTLFAESGLKVLPGQYLVEVPEIAGAGGDIQMNLSLSSANIKRVGNSRLHKVSFDIAGSSSNGENLETVPYDPSDPFCDDLITQGLVAYCEPNFYVEIDALPNDPLLSQLWGMSSGAGIDAPGAWEISTGSNEVIVAVIDTGIDYNHPDLQANLWVNPQEVPGSGQDESNTGYIDDVHGINVLNGSGNPYDDNGHGTHVAGTIGARGNNAAGVVGVNWNVKIMSLKFLNSAGGGSMAGAIEAIQYMTMMKKRGHNIRVSNNSWGGGGYSQLLANAIEEAEAEGIVFVAAAGNSARNNDVIAQYPANFEFSNVVSVASIDSSQKLSWFSNYGPSTVHIAAPGSHILSTLPGGGYGSLSGTSMAAPHVSGAIALLLSSEPGLSHTQLIKRTLESGMLESSLNGKLKFPRKLNVSRMLNNQIVPLPESGSGGNNLLVHAIHSESARVGFRGEQGFAIQGAGNGYVPVEFSFGRRGSCPDPSYVLLENGYAYFSVNVPRAARLFANFFVNTQDGVSRRFRTAGHRFRSNTSAAELRVRRRNFNRRQARIQNACDVLKDSLVASTSSF